MAFTIPHGGGASFADQGQFDSVDLDALLQGLGGNVAVSHGCAVSPSTGLTVAIAEGHVMLSSGLSFLFASTTIAHDAADGTHPRVDLVVIDSTGTKQIRKGTASASPGTAYPALSAGDILLAAVYIEAGLTTVGAGHIVDKRMLTMPQVWVKKTANQTVTNSTTLVNDNHLKLPIGASEEWWFEMWLFCDGEWQADIKVQWSLPSGCTMDWGGIRINVGQAVGSSQGQMDYFWDLGATAVLQLPTSSSGAVGSVAEMMGHRLFGRILNSTTPGTCQLQWAQNTANAAATTMRIGSRIRARRLA